MKSHDVTRVFEYIQTVVGNGISEPSTVGFRMSLEAKYQRIHTNYPPKEWTCHLTRDEIQKKYHLPSSIFAGGYVRFRGKYHINSSFHLITFQIFPSTQRTSLSINPTQVLANNPRKTLLMSVLVSKGCPPKISPIERSIANCASPCSKSAGKNASPSPASGKRSGILDSFVGGGHGRDMNSKSPCLQVNDSWSGTYFGIMFKEETYALHMFLCISGIPFWNISMHIPPYVFIFNKKSRICSSYLPVIWKILGLFSSPISREIRSPK